MIAPLCLVCLQPLKVYLAKYREAEKQAIAANAGSKGQQQSHSQQQQPSQSPA